MKPIPVSCCMIIKDERLLVAQKPSGVWEFPGGKQEPGETMFGCAIREVMEELGIIIRPIAELTPHVIETPGNKFYELVPVVCKYISGEVLLAEHISAKWVHIDELQQVSWSDADKILLEAFFIYRKDDKGH